MSEQGPKLPTIAEGTNWTDAENVFADDAARAVFNSTGQNDLKVTGFGFTIPLNATILGVSVTTQGQGASATAAQRQVRIGLTKNGSALTGTRKTGVQYDQSADTNVVSGGAADMWDATLTAAEVNAVTFGVLISDNDTTAAAISIDVVSMTITYSVPDFPDVKPDFTYVEGIQFKTEISQFESKIEQRRRKWGSGRLTLKLVWKALTQDEVAELWDFYKARYGAFEAFNIVNLNDSATYVVRFKEDNMTRDRFSAIIFSTGLEVIEANG